MFSCVAAKSETLTFTVNTDNGTLTMTSGGTTGPNFSKWTSSNPASPAVILSNTNNNISKVNTNQLALYHGEVAADYTLSVGEGYIITGYTITGVGANSSTSDTMAPTVVPSGGTSTTFAIGTSATVTKTGLAASSTTFSVGGAATSYVACTSFTVTVERATIVTYSLTTKVSNTTYTQRVTAKAGTPLTVPVALQRGYCKYKFLDVDNKEIQTYPTVDATVYVDYTVDSSTLPFSFTDDTTDPIYYYLKVNTASSGTTYQYITSAASISATQPSDNNGKWAFVGDPYNIKIISKAAATSYLSISGTPTFTDGSYYGLEMSAAGTNDTWELLQYSGGGFALRLRTLQNFNVFLNSGSSGNTFITLAKTPSTTPILDGGLFNSANKSRLTVEAPTVTVTYNVVNNDGVTVATGTGTSTVGSAPSLPNNLRRGFCKYGYDVAAITENTTIVNASYVVSGLPFEMSEDMNNLKYYALSANGYYIYKGTGTALAYTTTKPATFTNDYLWAFVGDPYGMTIYNKAAGTSYPLSESTANITTMNASANNTNITTQTPQLSNTNEKTTWGLFGYQTPGGAVDPSKFCLRLQGTTLYLRRDGTSKLYYYKLSDYINDAGQFYGASACNLYTSLLPVTEVTYTIYTPDNHTTAVAIIKQNSTIGEAPSLSAANRKDYCSYKYYTSDGFNTILNSITSATTAVNVESTFSGPFAASSADSPTWYYITLRGKYVAAIGPGAYPLTTSNGYNPMYQWAFIGNPYSGFKIINRWYGSAYNLCNRYGNRPGDNKYFNRRIGPSLIVESSDTTRWNLVKYNTTTFGFTNRNNANMSLNDIYRKGVMGFFWWDAKLAINSRMTAVKVSETAVTDKAALLEAAKPPVANAGSLFALKTSAATASLKTLVSTDATALSDADAKAIETVITDPAQYVKATNGYYRVTTTDGTMCLTVNSDASLKSVDITNAAYNAGSIFHLDSDDGISFVTSSQGLNIQKAKLYNESVKMGTSSAAIKLWPLGFARTVIQVADTTRVNYNVALYAISGGDVVTGSQTAATSQWILSPVTSLSVAMHAPATNPGSKSYATLYVPFDVVIPANTMAYTASSNTTTAVKCAIITDTTIPAGTPVLIVNTDANVGTITMLLPTLTPTASTIYSGNKFNGQYLSYTYAKDDRLFFGQGSVTGEAGFYLLTDVAKAKPVAANKAYYTLPVSGSGANPSGLLLFFDDTTGIRDVDVIIDWRNATIYDLQGRRVKFPSRGIYIVNGKKLFIK